MPKTRFNPNKALGKLSEQPPTQSIVDVKHFPGAPTLPTLNKFEELTPVEKAKYNNKYSIYYNIEKKKYNEYLLEQTSHIPIE